MNALLMNRRGHFLIPLFMLGISCPFGCTRFPVARVSPELRRTADFSREHRQLAEATLRQVTPAGFVTQVLPNGMRVSIFPDPLSPTVGMRMFYNVGIAHQPADAPELAHLLEHLVFNPALDPAAKPRLLDPLRTYGSHLSAATEADLTIYKTEVPKEAFFEALAMEAHRMAAAQFTESDVQAQIKSVEEEYRARFSLGPGLETLFSAVYRMLRSHPYGNYFTPRRNLSTLELAQITDFYKQHYQPSAAHLVIVGAVDSEATLLRVRELFGSLPDHPRKRLEVAPLAEMALPKAVELSLSGYPVKAALEVFPLPPSDHPDNVALSVLSQMLCKKWTLSICLDDRNPLFDHLVKKQHSALAAGFGYVGFYDNGPSNVEVGIVPFRAGGAWAFFAVYLPHRTQHTAFDLIDEQLRDLDRFDWLTEDNLRRAKHVLRKRIYLESYRPSDQAEAIGRSHYLLDDPRYAFDRAPAIEAITQADIKRVYARYLRRQEPVSIYVIPEKVPAWLRLFSWLYPALYPFIKHPLITHE